MTVSQKDALIDEQPQSLAAGEVKVDADAPHAGKKKKNKRSAKAKKKGTGFEEFYCDPPITPTEYKEERDLIYPRYRPFVDRIEECIQRYRARRRLSSERELLFSRYLLLGGIDASVRQFQSTRNIGDDILQDATKSSVREMIADDVIQRGGDGNRNPRFYNPNYSEHWDVDFTGVAAGFVSEHLPTLVGTQSAQYAMGVNVVLNFLKYVDLHDVCPEYADDVKSAQSICLRALEEVPATTKLLQLLPGHFNAALSVLHVKQEDGGSSDIDNYFGKALPDVKQAKASHAATLSILMGANWFPTAGEWFITETAELTFEVLAIDLPSDITCAKYKAINQHLTNYANIQPCGTITARPVVVPDGWDNNMTATMPPGADKESQFVLEEDILHLMVVGMKLTMEVCTLNIGLKFIKSVTQVRPSFYIFLPQELMFHYKEPLPNDRPAKSVHDCDDENDVRMGVPVVEADD
ncbi:Argonaute complex, subunit Arb1 [Corynascus novoguineensis]|uniref:Argonaute complex, subunit Arb1 n=1 Tax=Corynascus novoguineensis TaxID=1126955 RepID=A0AAN7HU16_9PEZI|nr:Argonaute complex, subunit Arb1 [Corynascus novoguineensis]